MHDLPANIAVLAGLILLCPLASFAVLIFTGRRLPRGGDWLALSGVGLSWAMSMGVFLYAVVAHDPGLRLSWAVDWFSAGEFLLRFGFLVDNLTAVMLMVVTSVSLLVHLFSVGYMHGEENYSRYFAYLGLFTFSMLLLVLTDNFLVLFVSWELVGLSSYLLIGFYVLKDSASAAAKKAFITTRVGDVGMWIAIMLLGAWMANHGVREHPFSFEAVFGQVDSGLLGGALLTVIAVCLFAGAVGKSAQFPLHVWLPDAMEGPTPVSALIHAATMVAAGVYLVGRAYPMFTPSACLVVAYTGAVTAVFAGSIAMTQFDIKRVLAYSTLSQLGYMMASLGVGGYNAGLFHLMTHAFFKALLFLVSGSVILALHHEQDIRKMGGLWRKLPLTTVAMVAATLAICGVPGFSGFFSKDAILEAGLEFGLEHPQHAIIPLLLLAGAGMTAFYMFRLLFLTFFGHPRDHHAYDHAHEGPWSMRTTLLILAVLSVVAGYGHWFQALVVGPGAHHLAAVAEGHGGVLAVTAAHGTEGGALPLSLALLGGGLSTHSARQVVLSLSLVIGGLGIWLSWLVYFRGRILPEALARAMGPIHTLVAGKYFVDEAYQAALIRPCVRLAHLCRRFDTRVIDWVVDSVGHAGRAVAAAIGVYDKVFVDGMVNLVAHVSQILGRALNLLQTGVIQNYLLKVAGAIAVLLLAWRLAHG